MKAKGVLFPRDHDEKKCLDDERIAVALML